MSTFVENLTELASVKLDIKEALIEKGSNPTGGMTTYAEAIRNISSLIRDLHVLDINHLLNLLIGNSYDCVIANSNISLGYLLGLDGDNLVQELHGFGTRGKLTLAANACLSNPKFLFTVTKIANPSEEYISRHFTISGNGIASAGGPTGYNTSRLQLSPGNESTVHIDFDGTFPQTIYLSASGANKCKCDLYDEDNRLLFSASASLPYTDIELYAKIEINEPITIRCVCTKISGNGTGYFYFALPQEVLESISKSGEYTIKHTVSGKYLNINQNGSITFNSNAFNLTLEGLPTNISLMAAIELPDDTIKEEVLMIKDISSQTYLCSQGADNFSLSINPNDTSLWTLYMLT